MYFFMNEIKHKGTVLERNGDVVKVLLLEASGCATCSVKGSCSVGDVEQKILEIHSSDNNLDIGDEVYVLMSNKKAMEALFWAYILPFIVLLATIVILSNYLNELYIGLIAIGMLTAYYLILSLNKSFFEKQFNLEIKSKLL